MNKKQFFDHGRKVLFPNGYIQSQVDNINVIIDEFRLYAGMDYRHLAYVLATVHHETGGTMAPIREIGRGAGKDYGKKLKYGNGPGKRVAYTTPNHIFYGRGYPQLTWYENYEMATKNNNRGWDFLNNPDLMLSPGPSAWVLIYGMKYGMFTGYQLSDCINDAKTDFYHARKIVNGLEAATKIGALAGEFYNGLILI